MDEDPSSRLTVRVDDPAWHGLVSEVEARCQEAIDALFAVVEVPPDVADAPIDLLLADDATLRALNTTWRGRDETTDVLSFPARSLVPEALHGTSSDPPGSPLGDLALAWQTVERDARAEAKPVTEHVQHLVVHGVLHLLGHAHEDDDEARRMEGLERQILARLGIPDPYAVAGPR
jgi:probable rRNA maturation factor